MTVSVLTPVLNEGDVLERTVPTMLAQRLSGEVEFIFAAGNSSDRSRDIMSAFAARDPRVRMVDNPSGRTPDGLNLALEHARGEYVARMDAHCFYPVSYLADGIARLKRGDVAWVSGPAVLRAHGGSSGAIVLALRSPLGRGPSRRRAGLNGQPQGENELGTSVFLGVWRRATLERYGGWDPRWLRNQDSELAARFLAEGERIVSVPSMAAELLPRRTLRAFLHQYHEFGRYRVRTLARHPVARRRTCSLGLAPALVAALPVAVAGPRCLRDLARIGAGAYGAAVTAESVRLLWASAARQRVAASRLDVARLPLALVVMHLGFGAGMWRGLAEAGLARATNAMRRGIPSTGRDFRPRRGK